MVIRKERSTIKFAGSVSSPVVQKTTINSLQTDVQLSSRAQPYPSGHYINKLDWRNDSGTSWINIYLFILMNHQVQAGQNNQKGFGWVSWANGSAGPKPTHDPAKSQMVTAGPAAWGHMSVDRTARCALRVVHRTVQDVRASPAHSSLRQPARQSSSPSSGHFPPLLLFNSLLCWLFSIFFSLIQDGWTTGTILWKELISCTIVVVVLYRINRHVLWNERRREILGSLGSLTRS